MHNISFTKDGKGIKIPTESGAPVRLTDARVFTQSTPWHNLGKVFQDELTLTSSPSYALNAYTAIDPPIFTKGGRRFEFDNFSEIEAFLSDGGRVVYDLDTELLPSYANIGGRFQMVPYAYVVNNNAAQVFNGDEWVLQPNIIDQVPSGITSEDDWKRLNDDDYSGYTRSLRYEAIPPRRVFKMLDEILRKETGLQMKAHSAGALGKNGSKGVWGSVPLPKWHGDVVRALQTDVESYLTFYIDPVGTMYVVETDILVVCQNTLIMALGSAARKMKVEHNLGAEDRLRTALEGVWEANKEAQQLVQATMMHLRDTEVSTEQVQLAAQGMYPLPGKPDEELVGVTSYNARRQIWERNVHRTLAMREAFVALWENPSHYEEELGITMGIPDELANTGFAATQVATFLGTYYPGKLDNVVTSFIKGNRLKNTNSAINGVLMGGNLEVDGYLSGEPETVKVKGVGLPQELKEAYRTRISNGGYSPIQTQIN